MDGINRVGVCGTWSMRKWEGIDALMTLGLVGLGQSE